METPVFRQGLLILAGATLVFALAAALECHSVVTASDPNGPFLPSALYGLVLWGWWGTAAAVLWTVAENGTADFFSRRATTLQLLVGPALALAHIWMLQRTVEALVRGWPALGPAGYGSLQYIAWNRFFSELLIYGFAFAFVGMVRLKLESQREEMRALALENAALGGPLARAANAARAAFPLQYLERHRIFGGTRP